MVKVDWLDRLTFREIEMINEKQKRNSNFMYLMIEFPYINFDNTEFTVVYFEKVSRKQISELLMMILIIIMFESVKRPIIIITIIYTISFLILSL